MTGLNPEVIMGRAREAASTIANQHGLTVDDAEIISFGSNIILRLRPHPVVARVSGVASYVRRNDEGLAREIDVTRHLSNADAPVVPLTRLIPPGPHRKDGLVVTFWECVEQQTPPADAFSSIDALRRCRLALADYPGTLPYLHGYAETRRLFMQLWRDSALHPSEARDIVHRVAALDHALEAMRDAATVPLHGDAHPGNVLSVRTADGDRPLWIDWEDVSTGPLEWDYACMIVGYREMEFDEAHEEALISTGGDEIDRNRLDIMIDARELQFAMWEAALTRLKSL